MHLVDNSADDVNSAAQKSGSASPHGRGGSGGRSGGDGGGDGGGGDGGGRSGGGGDGGGAGQKKQDPLHLSQNRSCLHLVDSSADEVNSAAQKSGSASPHGRGGSGGGDGGGAGQKKQDPLHLSQNRSCLHLVDSSADEVNSAAQKSGSASPHGRGGNGGGDGGGGGGGAGSSGGGGGGGLGPEQNPQFRWQRSRCGGVKHLRTLSISVINSLLQ